MNAKLIAIGLLVSITLASCAPAAKNAPPLVETKTAAPTLIPTATQTPAPEELADSTGLPAWVDEFVHAYGGTVEVEGTAMDANQLTAELIEHSDRYIEARQAAGTETLFLVVNGVPIAMRQANGRWEEASMAALSEQSGVTFELSPRIPGDRIPEYVAILKKVAGKNTRFYFPGEMDTCRIYNGFSADDWRSVIANWEGIQKDLDEGIVPEGYPYEWQGVYDIMNFASEHVEDPQFRGQHLVEGRLNYCLLAESIIALWENEGFSRDDMLKVLEFVVRTRVLQFPEVTSWDVQDEMIATDIQWTVGGNDHYRFWLNATGKSPVELTLLVGGWIKKDNPAAKTYIVESDVFDFSDPVGQWLRGAFAYYIKEVAKNNIGEDGVPRVDGFIEENNLSIHYGLDTAQIAATIDLYQSWGLEIGGSETMIFVDEQSIQESLALRRVSRVPEEERAQAQAKMYRDLLTLYLEKGITTFGLGGIDDYNAWTNDVGYWDADPLLFDDELRAKPAYYAIVQVLYEHLP